ncbi:hypothetical protein PanWU01x14_053730 [Parasponia andersonii]|uniref:Uncharacterized protein n=1 Tax=Parasponia andersonii TaxID=3476 RepID=A0A2P5DLK3_PARAD|nr:hypothetical protein PanWU01x14_053730 [Parasponia andersonii]
MENRGIGRLIFTVSLPILSENLPRPHCRRQTQSLLQRLQLQLRTGTAKHPSSQAHFVLASSSCKEEIKKRTDENG